MEDVAEVQTKTPRPYGFQPGVSGNPRGKPKEDKLLPPLLRDMRWAYRNATDPRKKGTPQQQSLRQMWKDKPQEFMALMGKLEAQHKPQKKDAAAAKEDAGTGRALELVERWLSQWEAPDAGPPQK